MSYRDARLRQFFHGHFHEDWDSQGAETWQDVVAQYVAAAERRTVLLLRDDLRAWLRATEFGPDRADALPASFGCDYPPGPDGLDERQWVAAIADLLDQLAGG
jgi:hypothetical protein